MSTAAAAGMQAALLIREKQRLRRKKFRKGRHDLPSHVATRDIGPFPEYPPGFECSQGRTAWQERERGRRCSLSEEARQHRIKQTEAHHRWMKRNRIHDTTYGGGSDEDEDYVAFHQSAAANALLYVGLGTTALGSIIFFVGTGEKGFKTLELRLIGPTLIVAGLLCCLIRVLLCACPTTCFKSRAKSRLKNDPCPHSRNGFRRHHHHHHHHRYPEGGALNQVDFVPADKTALLTHKHTRKKVSIVPPNYSLPSTSTSEFKELPSLNLENEIRKLSIPQIHLPSVPDSEEHSNLSRKESVLEMTTMDLCYDAQSVSSNESDGPTVIEQKASKLTRLREPALQSDLVGPVSTPPPSEFLETFSVVIERASDASNDISEPSALVENIKRATPSDKHSGIVLSPLQLGQ
ncbi:hypothetical protein ABEB36_008887 [Hypothenemus hampei]|uniref:Uncharacterized protein n=1 Tax=Hypothenemus hampei TaxID=57062 RepID=A0ABD1ENF0_HYPHA